MNKTYKVAIINSVYKIGSTGRLCFDLCNFMNAQENFECKVFYGREKQQKDDTSFYFSNKLSVFIDGLLSRTFDNAGFNSKFVTKKLVNQLLEFGPNILIINNLHGYYINLKILFNYIRKYRIPAIFICHDCWNFTGHCSHFTFIRCSKWITGCSSCPQKASYPKSLLLDNSKSNYLKKMNLFNKLECKYFIAPSNWLSNVINQSFLKKSKVTVINNGIDLSAFRNYSKRTHSNKTRILCVANVWNERKGLNDIYSLSKKLDSSFEILIVGKIKKKISFPPNVEVIKRTSNSSTLIDLYNSCDVFFNPTYEDTYPSVNLEAMACGLPVVSYNSGGAIEMIDANYSVERGDIDKAIELIGNIAKKKYIYDFSKCCNFSKNIMLNKYYNIIKQILNIKE